MNNETTKGNEGNTNSKLVKEEVKDKDRCKTEAPSTYQIKEENKVPPQRIKFEEAIIFVKKLKKYFQNDDHLFKSFFDNLKIYMEVHKSIYEVYHKVAKLLNGHPDLLEEFTQLFADSSAIGILKQYLY
ncbi:hypothetical protein P3L10_027727 [Capsicum annuum]